MQELIYLTQRIPFPPTKGEKIRQFQVLCYLRQRYVVHLGCLIDDPADWQHTGVLRELCGETYFAKLNPWTARLACLPCLIGSIPLSVPYFFDRGLQEWIKDVLTRRRPNAAFVSSSVMGQYLLDAPYRPPRVVMDFIDVDSDKWRQYGDTRSWPMSWICRRESKTLLEFDRRLAHAFDASVFVSRAEAALFNRLAPDVSAKTHQVNNGVDSIYFSPDAAAENPYDRGRPVVVFTGTMSYWPNVDAVTWFAEQVLPRLRRAIPSVAFYIVGSHPSQQVQRLGGLPGVTVTGRVADVRPYLAYAAVVVAPLRIANGVQNKVLEAMAMAKIVVASPRALAGVEPEAARNVLVADGPESFAETVRRAITDGDLCGLGPRARTAVERFYNWDKNLREFAPLLQPAA
jgi:sugar transferase (PEP-CTERM/EpsH1 system associated)